MRDKVQPKLPTEGLIASDVEPRDVQWLWWPRFPEGNITIIGARGGTGKGLMCVNIAARITKELKWPFSDGDRAPHGNVAWCETEDSFHTTVVPRLTAAKADRNRVVLIKPHEFFKFNLRAYIEDQGIRLIVLSPLNSFLKGLKDPNSGQNVRNALERIQGHIEDTNCAVVGIGHLNKKSDLSAIERLLGSVEYANFVRSVVMLRREEGGIVRVVHVLSNLGIVADDLIFTIENTRPDKPRGQYITVQWDRPNENVDQATMFDQQKVAHDDSAGQWLAKRLEDGEEVECQDIFEEGAKYSYTESALKQAKARDPKIRHRKEGFGPKQKVFWWREK